MPSLQPVALLEQVLQQLQQRMRQEQFDTWFRGVQIGELSDEEVEFIAPSGFVRDWLNRNYLGTLAAAVREVSGRDLRVHISLALISELQTKVVQECFFKMLNDLFNGVI